MIPLFLWICSFFWLNKVIQCIIGSQPKLLGHRSKIECIKRTLNMTIFFFFQSPDILRFMLCKKKTLIVQMYQFFWYQVTKVQNKTQLHRLYSLKPSFYKKSHFLRFFFVITFTQFNISRQLFWLRKRSRNAMKFVKIFRMKNSKFAHHLMVYIPMD